VLNQTIIVNGQAMTIVGVAPEGFDGTTLGTRPRVYVPITMRGLMNPGFRGFENRRSYWVYVFGRLKPGVTEAQATRAINAAYAPIVQNVEAPLQEGMSDATLKRFREKQVAVEDGRRGQSSVHGEARTPLLLLFAITGIVLLIACANIANLLLARGASRATEMAVRLSLGAGRRHVLVQLLTESVLLALVGGAASLLVARWTLSGIGSLLPTEASSTLTLELNAGVALFAGLVAIGTGLLFGMFPALHSTRPDLISTLRASSGQPSGARAAARFRTSLVTAQIALSMALLIPAGLFIKSLVNVSRVDLGLNPQNVVAFGISPELSGYDSTRSKLLFERTEDELATLPGVTAVTGAVVPILAGNNWGNDVRVQGFQSGPDIDSNASFNMVAPGYFRTLGMTLLSGREFTRADDRGSQKVAIVNEAFVKKFNLGADAVGKFMSQGGDTLDIQIVGVAKDAKYSEVKDDVPPVFFIPYRQVGRVGSMTFYARTTQRPELLLSGVRQAMSRIDPNLPLEEMKTLPQQVKENVFLDRMISVLGAAFAVLATLLAAVGLYGVLAYTVAQRTREIGVRMALGADGRRVRGMVVRQVTRMVVVGGLLGFAAALALGRAASSLLFGLQGHDPTVMLAAAVVLSLVALGAGYLPALRASRVDPMQALRYE
jgi:predicted permease